MNDDSLRLAGLGSRATKVTGISLVVCLSQDEVLRANLLASPCLQPGSRNELIAIRHAESAAGGLSMGIARARNDLVVCVHQDVFLPSGWDRLFVNQFRMAEAEFGPIGVAGVYGVGEAIESPIDAGPWHLAAERIGWVYDRGRLLSEGPRLPVAVVTLDELLLVVRRDTPLRFDPVLGFHLYAADLCLQARERGLAVVALGAPCHHNSRRVGLPESFFPSARHFARKWAHRLPIATPCVVFDHQGAIHALGNTYPGEPAIAYAEPHLLHAEGCGVR
jgi:hypothetical protein